MSDLELANEYARKWHASEAECARLREALADMRRAAIDLANERCPDGGGPQCICRCVGEIGQCSSLRIKGDK